MLPRSHILAVRFGACLVLAALARKVSAASFSLNPRKFSRHFKCIVCNAIPMFESWRPSQPTRSLPGDFLNFAKSRHFRRLVARSPVSGEESRPSCAESLKSRGQSLRADFSISEICVGECPEIGCVFAETGSNPHRAVY